MIEDIEAMFLPRFTEAARTRLANAVIATEKRDPAALAAVVRDMHSIAGEAGLLGLREVVPIARDGETRAKRLSTERSDAAAEAMTETIRALAAIVDGLAKRI